MRLPLELKAPSSEKVAKKIPTTPAVMVNVPVTDVKRASPATAVVNVHVVKKYAAALNNMSESSPASSRVFCL